MHIRARPCVVGTRFDVIRIVFKGEVYRGCTQEDGDGGGDGFDDDNTTGTGEGQKDKARHI